MTNYKNFKDLDQEEVLQAKLQDYLFNLGFNADDNDSFFIIKGKFMYTLYLNDNRTKIEVLTIYLVKDGVPQADTFEEQEDPANIKFYIEETFKTKLPKEMI